MSKKSYASLRQIAEKFRHDLIKKDFVLFFAYNGTGKTRLSMEFKELGKKNEGRDTLYWGKPNNGTQIISAILIVLIEASINQLYGFFPFTLTTNWTTYAIYFRFHSFNAQNNEKCMFWNYALNNAYYNCKLIELENLQWKLHFRWFTISDIFFSKRLNYVRITT